MEEHTESDNYVFLIASCLAEVIMDEAISRKAPKCQGRGSSETEKPLG